MSLQKPPGALMPRTPGSFLPPRLMSPAPYLPRHSRSREILVRFPWRRADPQPEPVDDQGLVDAGRAVAQARAALAEARRRAPDVAQVVARLREIRAENHISERLAQAIQNGHGREGDGRAGGG